MLDRRSFVALSAAGFANAALAQGVSARTCYTMSFEKLTGGEIRLGDYAGRPILVVNTASLCGFTPQYAGLEATYKKYSFQGLVVCGFPCNQFGGQEPGTDADIKEFCTAKYNVTFPMFDKLEVNGDHRHPLYTLLAGTNSPFAGNIKWNFTKFLIGRDGKILARFGSMTKPDSEEVTKAIEAALAAK